MFDQPAPLIIMTDLVRPEPGRHFVLAYDDKMDEAAIRARCPDPKFVTTARCTARRLVFTQEGATVVPRLGTEVYGTVWDVDYAGLDKLDDSMDAFGVRERRSAFVRSPEGRLMLVNIYAIRNPEPGRPDPELVLRVAELAAGLGFPANYTSQIKGWLGAAVH